MLPYHCLDQARVCFQYTLKCCHPLFGSSQSMLSIHTEMLSYIFWIKLEYAFNTHWNVVIHCLDQVIEYAFNTHWNVVIHCLDQARVCFQYTLKCCYPLFGSSQSMLSIHTEMLSFIVWIKLEYAFNTHWNVVIHCLDQVRVCFKYTFIVYLDQARVCFQYTVKCCHPLFGSS